MGRVDGKSRMAREGIYVAATSLIGTGVAAT
jgi:hypothetical protein